MKRTLILGTSMLLLLTTILLLIPTNVNHHLAVQSINFKHTGTSNHIQVRQTTQGSSTAFAPNYSTKTEPYEVHLSVKPSTSTKYRSYYTSTESHEYKGKLLNYTTSRQNSQGNFQIQTQSLGDKVYANRIIGGTTDFPTANTNLFAQATSYNAQNAMAFSDSPKMNFLPHDPGDPVTPLGQGTILLFFGLGFIVTKVVQSRINS